MKSKMKLLTIILFWICNFSLTLATAKDSIDIMQTPEYFEIKTKTEELISKRYKDQLSTQIDSNLFSISTSVSFVFRPKPIEKLTPKVNEKAEDVAKPVESPMPEIAEILPEDLSTGIISFSPLMQQYKKELIELQNQSRREVVALQNQNRKEIMDLQNQMQIKMQGEKSEHLIDRLELKSIEISLGMDSGFSVAYRREIEDWLKKSIDVDFKKKGTYKISVIRKPNKIEEPAKIITTIDKVSNLQILIGLSLLGAMLFVVVLISKIFPSRESREQMQTALKIQEMKDLQAAAQRKELKLVNQNNNKKDNATDKSKDLATGASLEANSANYRDLQQKVFSLFFSVKTLNNNLFEAWFDQGLDGRIKAAAFIDAVLSRRGRDKDTDITLISDSVLLPEKWRKDSDLHRVFREFPQISIEERLFALEQVYWDMLSANLLGTNTLRTPFGILAGLPNGKIQKTLNRQDSKVRALALMHMPNEQVLNYMDQLTSIEKQKIVENSVLLQKIRIDELEKADQTLKSTVKQDELASGLVQLTDYLPNILQSLSVKEEIEWLPSAFLKLLDQGISIKQSYPSIAFISEWPEAMVKLLFEKLDIKVTATYLQIVPSMTDRVLPFLTPRMAQIVRDEVRKVKSINDKEIEKHLIQLKAKMLEYIEDGQINLSSVFIQEQQIDNRQERIAS